MGVSCEEKLDLVGYSGGETSDGTKPEEAARFATETNIDAMAILPVTFIFSKIKKVV